MKDKKQTLLRDKGWTHDGIWWHSPYTGIRYTQSLALDVEDLREWAQQETAYLMDKGHAMWALEENIDNRTLTQDESQEQQDKLNMLRLLTGNPNISLPPA